MRLPVFLTRLTSQNIRRSTIMPFTDPPSLRTRSQKSTFDARVTLVSVDEEDTKPRRRGRATPGKVKKEEDEGEEAKVKFEEEMEPPAKRRKGLGGATATSASGEGSSSKKPIASSMPRKSKPIKLSLDKPHPAPKRWEEAYETIKTQRATIIAPVDTMGCDNAGSHDPIAVAHLPTRTPAEERLSVLVSLMLSSQTKDEVTAAATLNLRLGLKGGLTVQGICEASVEEVQACINKVGFWRRKAEYIKGMAVVLRDEHESDVPNTLDGLVALKGVGPKMAFLCLSRAWGLNQGIGVDTHVHRITNRLGWHKPPTKEPEQTRLNLESWLPKDKHQEINHLLVGFGQMICLPIGPRCDLCSLSSIPRLCPSKQAVSKSRMLSSSPRKPKTEAKVEVKIEAGVLETGEGEVVVEGVVVKGEEGVEEVRKVVKGEEGVEGVEVKTEVKSLVW